MRNGSIAAMLDFAEFRVMINLLLSTSANSGKPWSKGDVSDLKDKWERGHTLHSAARFLCRTEEEVRLKMAELGLDLLRPRHFFN